MGELVLLTGVHRNVFAQLVFWKVNYFRAITAGHPMFMSSSFICVLGFEGRLDVYHEHLVRPTCPYQSSGFLTDMRSTTTAMGSTNSSYSTQKTSSVSQPSGPACVLPLDILEEIFLHLPAHRVVRVCRLVCHQWKEVADGESFWRERCRREGYHVHDASKLPIEWRLFYFLCKKRRNLLKNPRGEDKFRGWTILQNGGDRWRIEEPMEAHPNEEVQKNFVTSYGTCMKSQTVDLEKEGYSPAFMDYFQPPIRISDWYAPRWDCGSEYTMTVQLLDHKNTVLQEFTPETVYFPQWNDQQWHQLIHVFKNYGPGVRCIKFTHGGKDTQFWAGWYGIRVTDSCVEICPALDTDN